MTTRARYVSIVSYGSAAAMIAACSLAIDPDDLVEESGDASALTDVVADEASASVPGNDGSSSPGDASSEASPGCTPTGIEVCDDGIDNDCNGAVDCADPACADGFACVDPPPTGWTLIALADDTRPPCPAGYATSTDVKVVQGDGGATCACDCGSNCGATITLTKATGPTCTPTSGSDTFQANTTKCTGKSFDLGSGFTTVTSDGGACAPVETTTKTDLTDGRTCTPPALAGGGCPGAQRCMAKASGFALCVTKANANACPGAGFDHQRRTGTSATDQRTCTGCSCNAAECSVEVDLWTHPTCQGAADLQLTTACSSNAPLSNVKAYRSTTTNGCSQATPSLPQGALAFANERMICCP